MVLKQQKNSIYIFLFFGTSLFSSSSPSHRPQTKDHKQEKQKDETMAHQESSNYRIISEEDSKSKQSTKHSMDVPISGSIQLQMGRILKILLEPQHLHSQFDFNVPKSTGLVATQHSSAYCLNRKVQVPEDTQTSDGEPLLTPTNSYYTPG